MPTSTVELRYDSLGRVLEDSQSFGGNTRDATNTEFESYPVTEMTFPDGRTVESTYDPLYRRTLVHDPAGGGMDIGAWNFFGPSRVAELTLGNGLICSHMNNARTRSAIQEGQTTPGWGDRSSDRLGFDGAGRMITNRYLAGGVNGTTHAYDDPESVVGQTTAYDRSSNKFYERELHAESRSHLYQPFTNGNSVGGYDSLDRLRQYQRGVLSSTGGSGNAGGGSITTPISLSNTDESRTYDLDGLGNWRRTSFDAVGGSDTTQVRQHNGLNEITRTTVNSVNTDFAYDGAVGASNGNLADDGIRLYSWDAFNRLKEVKRKSDDQVIAEYDYDALNRRIRRVVSNGGLSTNIPNGTTDFLYADGKSQCCEERDGSNDPFKQYLWGIYIDELIQQKTFTTINGNAAGEYYLLSDTLYRTMALTDSGGTIVEAYDTDAYGNTLIFTAAGTGGDWFADDATQGDNPTCEFIFTGRRFDAETEVYFYRARFYVPSLGRFVSRDPIGYLSHDHNLYCYVGNNPLFFFDATGLSATGSCKIAIFAGHGIWQVWGEDPAVEVFREEHDTVNEEIVTGCGNYVTYVGCRGRTLNENVSEERQVPGYRGVAGSLTSRRMLPEIKDALTAAKELREIRSARTARDSAMTGDQSDTIAVRTCSDAIVSL